MCGAWLDVDGVGWGEVREQWGASIHSEGAGGGGFHKASLEQSFGVCYDFSVPL